MSTKKNKIAVEKTPAPQLQEVKLQGILLAEITLETSTKEILEIIKIKGHYANLWIDNSGNRISDLDAFNQREESFPLRLWRFPSERDIQNDLVDEWISDL